MVGRDCCIVRAPRKVLSTDLPQPLNRARDFLRNDKIQTCH